MCGEDREPIKETVSEVKPKPLFNFGRALRKLKEGEKIARKGWNTDKRFLTLQEPGCWDSNNQPYIQHHIKDPDDGSWARIPWGPCPADLLADDWYDWEE